MKRNLGIGLALGLALVSWSGAALAQRPAAPRTVVEVYKSPTCGCCAGWVTHLQMAGFTTRVTEMEDLSEVKKKNGVPEQTQSCHTATVDGYVLEGHVPAADIQRLLKERPTVAGLAVPGMPIGSPGMEVPNVKPQQFRTLSFTKEGKLGVFATHN
jgi:hypothetical protein